MIKNHINHTFWCLNDDSGDTGGLWKDIQFGVTQGADGKMEGKTTINWDEEKYDTYYYPATWKTLTSKKFIGLDHQVALGKDGISLNDFYANYASKEGSNLDGGKKADGTPIEITSSSTQTTTQTSTVTTTTTSTTSEVTTVTTNTLETGSDEFRVWGDANLDGNVNIADSVLVMQVATNPDKYDIGKSSSSIKEEGYKNADVDTSTKGLTNRDALYIQKYKLGLIDKLPV